MGLIWPHRVTITVPAGGTGGAFNADDVWVPEPGETPVVLYEGLANVNDAGRVTLGASTGRDEQGSPVTRSDAVCYLKKKNAAGTIPAGAVVHIVWPDKTTGDAVVIGHRRGDNSLDLRRV